MNCFPFQGIRNWNRPNSAATGQSITLYERHPFTGDHAGNPIADSFAIVARKVHLLRTQRLFSITQTDFLLFQNSCLMVLGDGVNWGYKAALASRCAVHGCMDFLNNSIFGAGAESRESKNLTTQEVIIN